MGKPMGGKHLGKHSGYDRRGLVAVVAGLVVLAGAGIALIRAEVPSPQKPIEKELDAKAFDAK